MSALAHIFIVIFVASLALMGLSFAVGHLIAWYKNRQFIDFLEKEASKD